MNALKDPKLLVVAILGILVLWAVVQSSVSSIPSRDSTQRRTAGTTENEGKSVLENQKLSPLIEKVRLYSGQVRNDDPAKEYIEIRASKDNTVPITITGWKLKSTEHNKSVSIGKASYIPIYPGRSFFSNDIQLEPGDRAYIISGFSPVNTSFRTNICTGYLSENKTFHPRLPRQCPNAEDERLEDFGIDSTPRKNSRDEECIKELKRINRCEDPGPPDRDLSQDCKEYIKKIGYELCTQLHVSDATFRGNEWYIYVGKLSDDIWGDENDTILLLDRSGNTVDTLTY